MPSARDAGCSCRYPWIFPASPPPARSPTFSSGCRSRTSSGVAVVVYAVGWFILERTTFGKRVYAVGSNRTVAVLSGIRADRIKIYCFMIVGFTASLAGIVSVSRLGAVSPNTGEGLEFEVIAAVVIGGTSLSGGQGDSPLDHRRDHHCADPELPQPGADRGVLAGFRHRDHHPRGGAARGAAAADLEPLMRAAP